MKKLFPILALTAAFALTGCGGDTDASSSSPNNSSFSSITSENSSTSSGLPDDDSSTSSSGSSSKPDDSAHEHTDNNDDGKCDSCKTGIQATLEFFAVNDLHGKFQDTDSNCGVDEMTTYLRQKQAANPNTVLLSSGDMWQGSPESNLTRGNIITEWMNDLDFTSMTLGNHEFDWGEEYIEQNADLAEFPILAINVYDPDTNERETYAQPSVMVQKNGVKIGIIGAIGDCLSSIAAEKTTDTTFKTDAALTALVKAESTRLRQQGADVIVYSLHDARVSNKYYYDESLSNGYVDLVFEGHSHTTVFEKDGYGVWHLQAGGDNTTGLSYAKIEVDLTQKKTNTTDAKIVRTSEYTHLDGDPIVNELLQKYDDVISKMDEGLGRNDSYRNSEELKNFAAEALFKVGYERWNSDPQYNGSIVLGGGFLNVRSPYELGVGKVTYGDIQSLFPFDNHVVLCRVTGARLLQQFINSNNYACYYGTEGETAVKNLNLNGTYYVVVDTYTANFNFQGLGWLEIVEYYDQENPFYTRDAIALLIKDGGLAANTPTEITSLADILEIGNTIPQGNETVDIFRTVGKIINIENTTYGNATIADDDGNTLYIYGMADLDGKRYDAMENKPQVGDVVTLDGKIKNYFGTIELIDTVVRDLQHSSPDDPLTPPEEDDTYTSIPDIIDIINGLPVNGQTTTEYYVKGEIVNVHNTTYGNVTIQDDDGNTLYIYGIKDLNDVRYDAMSNKPQVGDVVVLKGLLKNYYNNSNEQILEMVNSTLVELVNDNQTNNTNKPTNLSTLTLNNSFGGKGVSQYDSGNYGDYTSGGITFEYYRAYKAQSDTVTSLLPYVASANDGTLPGALYNVSPIYGIQSVSITYKSNAAAFLYTSDDRVANATAYTLPKASSFTELTFDVDTDNFFKLVTGGAQLDVKSLSFSYTNATVSYNTQKGLSGDNAFRLNAVTYNGTLVAGQSSVSVPVKVEYDGGRYAITQTKTYTYYTVEYVEAHPEIKDKAALITPEDVAAYYAAFKKFPANYAAKTNNLESILPSFSYLKTIFGGDTRYVSKYSRTTGYAQYVPYNSSNTVYYEFDIALSPDYGANNRGVGRVVSWEAGWVSDDYNAAPVSVYTDDHYATFQEYLNTGEFGTRFDAEMLATFMQWSAPDTVSAS